MFPKYCRQYKQYHHHSSERKLRNCSRRNGESCQMKSQLATYILMAKGATWENLQISLNGVTVAAFDGNSFKDTGIAFFSRPQRWLIRSVSISFRIKWSEVKWSRSVVSDSLRPHGLQPTRLLRPWDFPSKSPGVGCHFLLQCSPYSLLVFPGGSMVKTLPAMQKTWVWSLGWEDPLEKEMATHSSFLACRIPETERSLAGYSPWVTKSHTRLGD